MSKLTQSTPKNPASVQALFTRIAPDYDRMNNIISLGLQHTWRRYAMRQAHFLPGDTVLDLCCGTGDWTVSIANSIGRNGQVIGVDFSQAMVKLAQQKIADNNLTNEATVSFGDALHLPFPDNSFDLITIGFGMRNLADLNAGLTEMLRVLRPGGQLVCLESSQPTAPIIKPVWQWYFGTVMPWLGAVFAHAHDDYDYLQRTTQAFANYQTLAEAFETAGFEEVHYRRFTFGAAACHTGIKPTK
ncbi:demethylmenaquinone methyltransferase [Furfurilactobacillus rossiae]|uniref:demethylmenaquinone methyltransferase n=1 Tax=Furfurilactobacillus rossiae TaxID=231049 RepID=UPI001F266A21|nr:demethylmenaquinone methyltransferase [Furfurilactobacillus rossiae]MCF6166123.1 demethylmenaquinone methyltransferase [Furfurilactobacillus rossiae]